MLNPRTASGGMRLSLLLRPASMISPGNCSDRKSWGRRVKPMRLIILVIVTISSSFAQGSPGIIATWTQMGANGNVLARAIVTRSSCPSITLDGQARQMGIRAQPTPPTFSVMSCETGIPSGTTSASD